ncbi:MAG: ABC transporter permease [Oscillospiraceae bacterium]|nr:ABC transporter permease [Oscillospiraceae bacterium]
MKQFKTILGFELTNYFQNKVFLGVTLFLVITIAVVTNLPGIISAFSDSGVFSEDTIALTVADGLDAEYYKSLFSSAFEGSRIEITDDAEAMVQSGDASCGFYVDGEQDLRYFVPNITLTDSRGYTALEVMRSAAQYTGLVKNGVSPEDAAAILNPEINLETVNLGVDQTQNYLYTYVMVIALYMVILIYGQMVASAVAAEKSSRCMEVLITSADPVAMMFGKVIAAGAAGLFQLVAVFGSGFFFFNLNRGALEDIPVVGSLFDIPLELLIYMIVYFILGFFIYAFLYGAVGSMVSKVEEVGSAILPVNFSFIIVYMVVIFSLSSGSIDNIAMKVCSFFPLTSSMAMFARIALSSVPLWEKLTSVAILVVSVFGVGVLSAKIYRAGVLLYGVKPTIPQIIKALRKA